MSMSQIQAQTANAVASGANAALPMLVDKYRQEGNRAIEKAASRPDAEAALSAIKAKWKPVWDAWEVLRVAEDAWATALELGGDTTGALVGLKKAYCGLQGVWPDDVPVVPLAPLKCPSGKAEPAPGPAPGAS